MPMAMTPVWTPSQRYSRSKVYLWSPVMGEYPMKATRNPSPAEMSPLIGSFWVSDAIRLIPSSAMRKNSGGPNENTTERTTGSSNRKTT